MKGSCHEQYPDQGWVNFITIAANPGSGNLGNPSWRITFSPNPMDFSFSFGLSICDIVFYSVNGNIYGQVKRGACPDNIMDCSGGFVSLL